MELLWDGFTAAVGLIVRADPELRRIAALSLGVSVAAAAIAALYPTIAPYPSPFAVFGDSCARLT